MTNDHAPERNYRLLNPFEMIQEGDEYFSLASHKWRKTDSAGCKSGNDGSIYRRADTSPLGAAWMRNAAATAITSHGDKWRQLRTMHDGEEYMRGEEIVLHEAAKLVSLIPAPTHADLLAYALRLPDVAAMREALHGLEWACEQLAATRPHAAYLAMIDGGQADALLSLGARRQSARAVLAALDGGEG